MNRISSLNNLWCPIDSPATEFSDYVDLTCNEQDEVNEIEAGFERRVSAFENFFRTRCAQPVGLHKARIAFVSKGMFLIDTRKNMTELTII